MEDLDGFIPARLAGDDSLASWCTRHYDGADGLPARCPPQWPKGCRSERLWHQRRSKKTEGG